MHSICQAKLIPRINQSDKRLHLASKTDIVYQTTQYATVSIKQNLYRVSTSPISGSIWQVKLILCIRQPNMRQYLVSKTYTAYQTVRYAAASVKQNSYRVSDSPIRGSICHMKLILRIRPSHTRGSNRSISRSSMQV